MPTEESSLQEWIAIWTNCANSSRNSKQVLAQIEQRERSRTGIASLKVKFNSIFGYYIEISKSNLHLVPQDYDRKQTLVGAERFTTPELKEYEAKILDAQEKIVEIERRLFTELRTRDCGRGQANPADRTGAGGSRCAGIACSHCQPCGITAVLSFRRADGSELEIIEGRHPVIEQQEMSGGNERFVPNDLYLNGTTHNILLLTGPNMGGKSTYLRQTALIVILAQMGSFVPARSARLSMVDRVFTRIGASDNLARGRSTFMVEMTETAAILHTATARSLILLDEVGRGTSTYDGLAIAWAAVEYLHAQVRAKSLFATHYFELTELAEQLAGVKNYHVSVKETGGGIVFLRKVEPGAADRSYGIEVAKLAGLPNEVVVRAREVLPGTRVRRAASDGASIARGKSAGNAVDDFHADFAARAGQVAGSGFESDVTAGSFEFAGGVEETGRVGCSRMKDWDYDERDDLRLMRQYLEKCIDVETYRAQFFSMSAKRSVLGERASVVIQKAYSDADDYAPVVQLPYTIDEPTLRGLVASSVDELEALGDRLDQ